MVAHFTVIMMNLLEMGALMVVECDSFFVFDR